MEWIDNVLRDVAELPDRNSPEDWPEAMLVTGDELRQIIVTHAPAEPVNARLLAALKRLSFCAQTTGGVAGRDDELCSAIEASAKAIAEAEAQQDVPDEAWDDIKLAEMIMSDCGFSSRYAPLKERIAKRIAKHVAAKTNPQAKGD